GSVDLSTPAGQLLTKLAEALPQGRQFDITVFGSAPIQICIDPALASADVDLFSSTEEMRELVERLGLGQGQRTFFIQVSSGLNFRTSPQWAIRTQSTAVRNCTFRFPHPIDILIAKLHRLDDKDLLAFRTVIAKTGHPTES